MVVDLTREQLGQNFKRIREHSGFSREQIAEYLEKETDVIHAFEDGRLIIGMGIADLKRACDLFGITLKMLMEKEEYRPIAYSEIAEALTISEMESISRINRIALNLRRMNQIINEEKYEKPDADMQEVCLNIKPACNYLVQMFYKTGQKYSCSQTKLEKLLSILMLRYARKGVRIFKEALFRYEGCGTAISCFRLIFTSRDAYIHYTYDDNKMIITDEFDDELFENEGDAVNIYRNTDGLTEDLKEEIEHVFRNFGAYSNFDLGKLLNPIVECEGVTSYANLVSLERIAELYMDDLPERNVLTEYILGY